MKTVLRRVLSVVLALCLCTALMPSFTLAAEGDVCEIIGVTTYATLGDALDAVQDGDTIRLLKDIDYYDGIVIENKSITFNLNGFTLDVVNTTVGEAVYSSGLYVKGNATVALTGTGEFNVTGTQYGVYAEGGAETIVTNAVATGNDGCAAYAYGENAVITVEGDVTATGTGGIGAKGNSYGRVTVKGNVAANAENSGSDSDYDCAAVEAWDDGEVSVEGDVTATGTTSIGVLAAGSCVSVGGDVTGVLGGAYASASASIEITGNVRSTDISGFGVQATDNCGINVGGAVRSNGIGVYISESWNAAESEIVIEGVIDAPEYIKIGIEELAVEDGNLDPDTKEGYRIYTSEYQNLGGVFVAEFADGDGSEETPYLAACVNNPGEFPRKFPFQA